MTIYNTTFMNNVTNILELAQGVGSSAGSDYLLGYMILLLFSLVFLVLSYKVGIVRVLIVDGFLSTLLAILMYSAGLVPAVTLAYPFVIMIIALLFFLFT